LLASSLFRFTFKERAYVTYRQHTLDVQVSLVAYPPVGMWRLRSSISVNLTCPVIYR